MGICIYCNKNKAEHFICELCGDGMCEKCINDVLNKLSIISTDKCKKE